MKSTWRLFLLAGALGLSAGSAHAQDTSLTSLFQLRHPCPDCPPGGMGSLASPTDSAARPDAMNLAANEGLPLTPIMFGDSECVTAPLGGYHSIGNFIGAAAPYLAKIADNSSPAPMDRVYTTFNTYWNVLGAHIHVDVETIGFEKTFLDGDASIGVRLPFIQTTGGGAPNFSNTGDLSITAKYALLRDRETNSTLSVGMTLTLPTGPHVPVTTGQGVIDPVFFQPFVGGLYNTDTYFVHGFSSIIVPTDSRDVTVWFNDLGVGYWIYKGTGNAWISAIAPTAEIHINTPLNHRYPGSSTDISAISFADDVNFTFGATFFLRRHASLGLAYVVPVTGPKPFNGEAIIQLNVRF